jgi:hypothetical protein
VTGWRGCAGVLAALAAGLHPPVDAAAPAAQQVTLVCEAVYLPAREIWMRRVHIGFDNERVTSVNIDGVPVYSFTALGTVLLTALDNERIRIDTAAQAWQSDFRGQAQSQGRCERAN